MRPSCARRLLSSAAAVVGVSVGFADGAERDAQGLTVTEIDLVGLEHTREQVVLRELVNQVGRPYRTGDARRSQTRLERLGVFSAVAVEPRPRADGLVLGVEVRETTRYLPTVSIGLSDEDGVSAGPGFKSVNLFGRAMQFSFGARFGGTTEYETWLIDPWFAGNRLSYRLDAAYRERFNILDEFDEKTFDGGFRLSGPLSEPLRVGGRFELVSVRSEQDGVTLSAENHDIIPTAGLFTRYDTRDAVADTHAGWWNELELTRSGEAFGGDGDFWTLILDLRRYQPLGGRHQLAVFVLGTLRSGTVGTDIPVHQDFHIGGTNTVRGWGVDSREGKNQLLASSEYRYALLEKRAFQVFGVNLHLGLKLALFADLGIAWNEGREFTLEHAIGGAGVGLRVLFPFVDMIRLDVALGDPGAGIHSHVGVFEKAVMQRKRVR